MELAMFKYGSVIMFDVYVCLCVPDGPGHCAIMQGLSLGGGLGAILAIQLMQKAQEQTELK